MEMGKTTSMDWLDKKQLSVQKLNDLSFIITSKVRGNNKVTYIIKLSMSKSARYLTL